jgi:feruloyl esterase
MWSWYSRDVRNVLLTFRHLSKNVCKSETMIIPLFCLTFAVLFHHAGASEAFEQRCLAFQPQQIVARVNATRSIVQYASTGTTLALPDNDATCNRKAQIISTNICRIALSIQTSEQSNIIFEAWLPENWSGRFLATGNGGIDGCKYLCDT